MIDRFRIDSDCDYRYMTRPHRHRDMVTAWHTYDSVITTVARLRDVAAMPVFRDSSSGKSNRYLAMKRIRV